MCHTVPRCEREISPQGEQRRLALYQWVATDLATDQRSLSNALVQWRNEMISRLPSVRQLRIRIPWIFVGALQLKGQRALIDEHDAVYVLENEICGYYILGRCLVPPKTV